MKLLDLVGLHVDAASGTPLVIVREHDAPHRIVPIVVGPAEAASIAVALSGEPPPRPLSHDLMAALVRTLDVRVDRVEVTALQEGAFLAEVALAGRGGDLRLDARPSDGIALAVRVGAPLYMDDEVLEMAGCTVREEPDEAAIDQAVDEFRGYLDRLDPEALAAALGEGPPGGDAPGRGPGDDEAPPEPGR
jgi:hypothetical protein